MDYRATKPRIVLTFSVEFLSTWFWLGLLYLVATRDDHSVVSTNSAVASQKRRP